MDTILTKQSFWKILTPAQQQIMLDAADRRVYKKGTFLAGGQECLGMVLVESGELRVSLLSPEGREITLYRIEAGNICVLSAACVLKEITFEVQICAQKDSELTMIPSTELHRVWEDNTEFRCFVYEMALARFSDVMWTMQQLLFMRADQRLASVLLEQCRLNQSDELRMTHEQIAEQMASAREVVTRLLKYFAQENIVQLSRGKVTVLDRERLRSLVQE